MKTYEKEVVYVRRDSEGMITHVFDIETSKYLVVVDTAIKIDPRASDEMELQSSRFAKLVESHSKGGGLNGIAKKI